VNTSPLALARRSRRSITAAALVVMALTLPPSVTGQRTGPADEFSSGEGRREWLRDNPDSPQFGNVLLTAIDRASSLDEIDALLEEYLEAVESERTRGEILYRAGRVFETANRFSRAADFFAQASDLVPEEASILRDHAGMLLELGEMDQAIRLLTRIINTAPDRLQQRSAAVLRARAYLLGGNPSRARRHARSLLGGPDEPKVLFLLLEIARFTADHDLEEEILQRMSARFPAAPEVALADAEPPREHPPQVGHYPIPTRIFSGAYQPEDYETRAKETAAPEEPRASPPAAVTPPEPSPAPAAVVDEEDEPSRLDGIQTGSFRDRENAEYMVRDIEALGFSAAVRSVETESGRFFRVVIPVQEGTTVHEAQDRIVQLKEEGIEGFLLFRR
jgi:tetratricopeptide (TPR) repeat protein